MRVLLVRPPLPRHTIGLRHVMLCEPLELEYVAAGLAGHEVVILDLLVERGLEKCLRDFAPNVVGTSAYITGVNEVKRLCRAVKRWNTDCLTVVGGVHASVAHEDFADPSIDCIALCDGTTSMPEIVDTFARGDRLDTVSGLAIPDGSQLVLTEPRRYMPYPDELPLPRRDLVSHLRHRYYYVLNRPLALVKTTWGCPYRCDFCVPWRITGGKVFSRSAESIAEELAGIHCEDVYIVDDIFLMNPTRLAKLAQLLREQQIRKRYLVFGRADFIASNERIIEEWADLGLSAVLVGLEATTDSELATMRKGCSVDDNRRAIAVLQRHGVDVYGSLIPGPEYGPEDWQRLSDFIDENRLYYLNISPLTPLPGTTIWPEHEGEITAPRAAHGLWDLSHCVLPTRMSIRSYYRALRRVYSRACLDPRRRKLSLRPLPPFWSREFLRLQFGALRVYRQLGRAHRHHRPKEIERATQIEPFREPWRVRH